MINNSSENSFIASHITEYVHIGLNDAASEGNFVWVDGSPVDFILQGTFWNNTTNQDYAVMEWWSGMGEWELVSRWTNKLYVVEIPCSTASDMMITQVSGLSSGSHFPIGQNTVGFLATDDCGNLATCSFDIHISPVEICDGLDNNGNGEIDEGQIDSDGDGVCDDIDECPGFDDNEDVNNNGIPDGCDSDMQRGSIGDKVFEDLNDNGLQDAGEPGIADLFIGLYRPDTSIIDFRFTDPNGLYVFNDLPAGDYLIKFANPNEDFQTVTKDAGNDDSIDSDANFYGFTDLIHLNANEHNFNIDAGFYRPTQNPVDYCDAKGTMPWQQWIHNVNFVDVNNTSGKNRYGDFTHISTDIATKSTLVIALTPGFSYIHYDTYFRVWIDYNQDGDFEDSGELVTEGVYIGSASNWGNPTGEAVLGEITVPDNIPLGSTRMRVAMQKNAFPEACGTFSFGEVEDYTVNIVAGNLFAIPALQFSVWQLGTNAKLLWSTTTAYKNNHYEIERSMDGIHFELLEKQNNTVWTDEVALFQTLDQHPLEGDNFYRIKIVHLDGSFTYTNIQKLNFKAALTTIMLYPNPATERAHLGLSPLEGKAAIIKIFNTHAQVVFEKEFEQLPEQISLDLKEYINGVYTIWVQAKGRKAVSKRLVVQRMY